MVKSNLLRLSKAKVAAELHAKKDVLVNNSNIPIQLHTRSSFLMRKLTKNRSETKLRTQAKNTDDAVNDLVDEKGRL